MAAVDAEGGGRALDRELGGQKTRGKAAVGGDYGGFGRNGESSVSQTPKHVKGSSLQVALDAADRPDGTVDQVVHPFACLHPAEPRVSGLE